MIKPILLLFLQDGWSALMWASWEGHSEIVKYLVEAEAALNLKSRVRCPSNPYFYIALYSHNKGIVWSWYVYHLYRMMRVSWCNHCQWTYKDWKVSCRFQMIIRSPIKAGLDMKFLHSRILIIRYTAANVLKRITPSLMKATGWCVQGKWSTTRSPLLLCTRA